jgi:capsule polysaccharide export protein KpsE/RkpR
MFTNILGSPIALSSRVPVRLRSEDDPQNPVVQALQARLESIDSEILRLAKLASETDDARRQQQYWDLAKDLQKEARSIRAGLGAERVCAERPRWWNRLLRRHKVRH